MIVYFYYAVVNKKDQELVFYFISKTETNTSQMLFIVECSCS